MFVRTQEDVDRYLELVRKAAADARAWMAAYLERAGHREDIDGPMFRSLKHNGRTKSGVRRAMDPDAIDRVVRKHAGTLGLTRGYSAHSMRATFITTALENGAQLEDVQKARRPSRPEHDRLSCCNPADLAGM
jgi:integrase